MAAQDTVLRQRVADLIRADPRSQVEISRTAGVGVRTVSAIVTGDRADLRADVVARLGRALGLTPTALGKLLYETCTDPGQKAPENLSQKIPNCD